MKCIYICVYIRIYIYIYIYNMHMYRETENYLDICSMRIISNLIFGDMLLSFSSINYCRCTKRITTQVTAGATM